MPVLNILKQVDEPDDIELFMHLNSDCRQCLSARDTLSRIRFAFSVETRRSLVVTDVGKDAEKMGRTQSLPKEMASERGLMATGSYRRSGSQTFRPSGESHPYILRIPRTHMYRHPIATITLSSGHQSPSVSPLPTSLEIRLRSTVVPEWLIREQASVIQ